jgi:hypothetical protein
MSNDIVALWRPLDVINVPRDAREIKEIASYAKQLAPREISQVVKAFQDGSYEMGSSFVWQKTMAGLKTKLGALGMDFIGEMLDRKDIASSANPQQVLTDQDALRLAEELGFFPTSHTLRLRHAMEVINHFADSPQSADDEGMMPEEAVGALRVCVQTVLGHAFTESAFEFAEFRKQLEERTFQPHEAEVATLRAAPYFYQRTTLRVLLAVAKTAQGAQLEHVLANLNTFLPAIWDNLLHPDRQTVGWCYAEVYAEGKQTAASGLRNALLKVKGFDFVPENLRSRTFIEAAQRLIEAHNGWNNFYNEPAPMSVLAALGTTIPAPALAKCMTAMLCVKIGNPWGVSVSAEQLATQTLLKLTPDRWVYYFNECLPADDMILVKFTNQSMATRFINMVAEFHINSIFEQIRNTRRLLDFAINGNKRGVMDSATELFNKLRSR